MDPADLARQLLGQPITNPQPPTNVEAIKKFLKTRQGREAARSAIDRLVFNANIGQPLIRPAHQEIVKTLEGIMTGQSGYQAEAASTDPMNISAAQHAGFNRQDYTQ